mmetsp:Transcript_15507/g.29841  ORF Transcript_15507/g.29841 Transcript_15507/m.29841 type:complete len:518 (+) Transcript_15507:238-1791(+)
MFSTRWLLPDYFCSSFQMRRCPFLAVISAVALLGVPGATIDLGEGSLKSLQRAYERNGIATCATSVRIDGVGGSRHGAEDKHSAELDYSYRLQKGGRASSRVPVDWVARHDAHTKYMHAPSVEALRNTTLVAAWQAAPVSAECSGLQHLQYSVGVMKSVSQGGDAEGAVQWGASRSVPLPDDIGPAWAPVLFLPPRSTRLWLIFSRGRGGCRSKRARWCVDADAWPPGGDIMVTQLHLPTGNWDSAPRILYSQDEELGIPKVSSNRPIILSTGRWLLPFHRENALLDKEIFSACSDMQGVSSSGVLVSDDEGRTWRAEGQVKSMLTWLIEPSIVEVKQFGDKPVEPKVLMLLRSSAQRAWATESADGGIHWGQVHQMFDLPNPDSKLSLLRLNPGGELAVAFNDHVDKRDNLRVAISTDNGHTWIRVATIETSDDNQDSRRSGLYLHYPSLVQNGCFLHVVYSRYYAKGVLISSNDTSGWSQGIRSATIDLKHILPREPSFLDQERHRSWLTKDSHS